MAFVLGFGNAADVALMLGSGEHEHVILVPIGADDETGEAYTLTVALGLAAGGLFAERELFFYISKGDEYGGAYAYWDGSATKAHIPIKSDRTEIMAIVVRALGILLGELNPVSVVLNTYGDHLPDKAIVKYLTICASLIGSGYAVQELEPYAGVRTWVAERLAQAND